MILISTVQLLRALLKKILMVLPQEFKQSFLFCSIIWMDVKDCRDNIRMTAFGCQNGLVKVAVTYKNLGNAFT